MKPMSASLLRCVRAAVLSAFLIDGCECFLPIQGRKHYSASLQSPRSSPSLTKLKGVAPILDLTTSHPHLLRVLTVGSSLSLLLGYQIRLQRGEASGARSSWRSVQADTRQDWSKFVRQTEGWLYAVQTLRNAITANTFLATTVLSLLTVTTGKLWTTQHGTLYPRCKFSTVALCMLRSAYEFLQSARLMTYAGFMFPVTKGSKVDSVMRKSSLAQWSGLRWLYCSLAMMAWTLGGDQLFLVVSLMLIRFFWVIDRVPCDVE